MKRFPWSENLLLPAAALLIGVAFAGIGQATQAHAAPLTAPLKILSFNFNSEDAPNDSDNVIRDLRFRAITHWITQNEPDIIVMQESWNYRGDPSVGISIARAMGYDVAYHVGMGFPGYFLDSDVILAKKNLMMSHEQDFVLPHSAPWLGDGKTWVIPFGAVSWAVGVKLTLRNGDPLYVYTSHLIQSSASDRGDGIQAILKNARETVAADGLNWERANVIIAGDFNSDPWDPGPVYLTHQGFQDAFAVTHPGDTSCSNCGDMTKPWFDPIAIGSALVPAQTSEDTSDRYDYVFTHSPSFKALASTLIFSTPYQNVWMSDHYGMFATLGDDSMPKPPNPVHDAPDVENSRIVTITDADFLCSDPWNNNGTDDGSGCSSSLADLVVNGPRGITVLNRSSFYFEMSLEGPGDIFTSPNAALNPGEEAAFSFDTPGSFALTIRNNAEQPNPYRAVISSTVDVQKTGY